MLVLHAVWTAAGRCALWAEDSALPQRERGAKASSKAVPHPFALSGAQLRDKLGWGIVAELDLHLPSYATAPTSSPELVRDPISSGPSPRGAVRQRRWTVPIVYLDLPGDLPEDLRLGASARYLCLLAEFADDLVTRGRVVPSVEGGLSARWLPVLTGLDSTRFADLVRRMPPAFRATQPGTSAEDLLLTALPHLVDGLTRDTLRGRPDREPTTITERWLSALTGDPALPDEAGELRLPLEQWRGTINQRSPLRTVLRLRSPLQSVREEDWRVEFLMQAIDEPSVLVPAAEVWQGGVLHRWVEFPEDQLLADLGRAVRIFPGLDAALSGKRPTHLITGLDGAYEFLRAAAELEQAGFGVQLPSWWKQDLSLTLTASSPQQAGTVTKDEHFLGLKELVDYRWELALGDRELTEAELTELAQAQVPLVQLRGQWVHVDPQRLAAGLRFLRKQREGQLTAGEVLQRAGLVLDLPWDDEGMRLPVSRVYADGWLGDLLSGTAEQQLEPIEPPAGFTAELRPYQQRGLAWLAFMDALGLGACLADDMGLGKTVQLLALEAHVRAQRSDTGPTLVVCPMSVAGNWQREAARFAPMLRTHVHHGSERVSAGLAGYDLVITTYALATRDRELLAGIGWERVVLDEAQNIKNSGTQLAEAVREFPARHRVALTGTPVENRLAELWSIMDFLNPGQFATLNTFRARFSVPIERHADQKAATRLRRLTGPFLLRRLKSDPTIISDLPEKVEITQYCPLTTEQATLYQAVVSDMLTKISESEGIQRRGLILATMTKLKQVCNHPAQLLGDGSRIAGRSGKLERLEAILTEVVAEGDKALCFTQYVQFGGMLVPHLAARLGVEVLFLHGGTSKTAREEMVQRFQTSTKPMVFLLSLKAGGTGLNLTAANHVIHLDRWWNPAVEDQASDRAHRIGARRDVQVRKLVCLGTLEEKIDAMISDKRALAGLAVGSGEGWLTELSTGRLRELLTLTGENVE
ncbi:DEAD/DEAH box helicase [Pseudonocardiaceae bacterium YIM PH 21723]|nr:DEAD/DEAH box helicase [Pseudonocardiaceae bacterium YIM PH 21723]